MLSSALSTQFQRPRPLPFASWVWGLLGGEWIPRLSLASSSRFSSSYPAPGNHPPPLDQRAKSPDPFLKGRVRRSLWPAAVAPGSRLLPKHYSAPSQGALGPYFEASDKEGLQGHLEPVPAPRSRPDSGSNLGSGPPLLQPPRNAPSPSVAATCPAPAVFTRGGRGGAGRARGLDQSEAEEERERMEEGGGGGRVLVLASGKCRRTQTSHCG